MSYRSLSAHLLISILVLLAAGCGGDSEAGFAATDLTVEQVQEAIKTMGELQLLDVRTQKEWDDGRIDGAIHIPVADLESRIGELDKTKPVLTYCAVGGRSAKALKILEAAGFTTRGHLAAGIRGWRKADLPVVK